MRIEKTLQDWSAGGRDRAAKLLSAYPEKRSAVMPLLYLASLEHGHVTEGGIKQVAELTDLTSIQVQSVASFYTMYKRRPVGEYLVSVCTSLSCFLMEADDVLRAVESETKALDGNTSVDGKFSVEHVECIGACGGAPAVQVNYELVEGVTSEQGRAMCKWLGEAQPRVIMGDQLQEMFGGAKSFDWGGPEPEGAVAPVPAFEPYGSAGSEGAR